MPLHRIAVIPGDGIGKEVVPEGVRVLEAAAAIEHAIEHVLSETTIRTPDMGGSATTREMGQAIEDALA